MNKDEANRCLDLAFIQYNKGDYQKVQIFELIILKAKSLFEKSNRLHNSKKAQDFIGLCQEKIARDQQKKVQQDNYEKKQQQEARSSEPSYTQDQVNVATRIKNLKDFYEILGVSKTASDAELKKAYRKLAIQLHPDKNKAPAARDAFKKVAQAYDCLSNADKRASYDRYGNDDPQQQYSQQYQDVSPNDIFNMFFSNGFGGGSNFFYQEQDFNNPFDVFGFGSGFQQRRAPRRQRQHQQHYQQQQQQQQQYRNQRTPNNQNKLGSLLTFFPLMIIILAYFFHSMSRGITMPISFSYNNKFNTMKRTSNLEVKYYVDNQFYDTFASRTKLLSLENEIESSYWEKLHNNCEDRRGKKQLLILKGYKQKAQQIDLAVCDEARQIRKKIAYVRQRDRQYIQ